MTRRTAAIAVLLGIALYATSPRTFAWNAAGHRLTAAIAWMEMDAATRSRVARLLAAHPDHALWVARARSADAAYGAFLEASTWPDDIRRDARFHDDAEPATPAIPGFPDMARHGRWHYVDQPLSGLAVAHAGNGELPQRIARLSATLADGNSGIAARACALPWLIHLVGDAHQPLHTVSRYDEEGQGDEGGNRVWIDDPQRPRRRERTRHACWYDLPGPPWLRGERLDAAAARLGAAAGRPVSPATVGDWLQEGRRLAQTAVYEGLEGEVPTVTPAYQERAQRVANERILLAGRRLARLLEQLLQKQ